MNLSKSANINQYWSRLIVEELIRNGVDHFCICPGSRSTPLTSAVAEHKKASTTVHFDERGAAFFALGYASSHGKPAAVITTSGSAVANLFPAVMEASKKKQPMILLTADRPPELRYTGANQTVDQVKIFGNYVRFFFDMPCPEPCTKPEMVLTTIDQIVYQSKGLPPGPVHLNCMFREPLEAKPIGFVAPKPSDIYSAWQKNTEPFTSYTYAGKVLGKDQIGELERRVMRIKKGVIVVGKLKFDKQRKAVLKLAEKLNWPVFADVTSGLRSGADHSHVIEHFDSLLGTPKGQKAITFDGVLHLGGRMTSKRWYDCIDRVGPQEYIMIINHPLRNDPNHTTTYRIESHISQPCDALAKRLKQRPGNSLLSQLKRASDAIDAKLNDDLKRDILSESAAVRQVISDIPKSTGLFLAASLPVREADRFAPKRSALKLINSNRGASGIDGTIASAAGWAYGLKTPVTVLSGDLAALYDLNSLALLKSNSQPLVIVILNNNGGGIFSFLPVADKEPNFEQFFSTPHGLQFDAAADMFDINYARPATVKDLSVCYRAALKSRTSTIIEVIADRDHTVADHDRIQKLCTATVNQIL